MSASTVTMEELELESAELLPNRETLCCGGSYHPGHSVSFTQVGYGNTAQAGLVNVSAAQRQLRQHPQPRVRQHLVAPESRCSRSCANTCGVAQEKGRPVPPDGPLSARCV